MSASEKLKTLNDHEAVEDLRDALEDALPQIVAVVEAAELALPYKDWDAGGHPKLRMPERDDLDDLRAALSALDEALG